MVHIMSVGPTPSSQDGLGGPLVEQITDGPPVMTPPAAASSKPAAVTLESTPKPTGSSSSSTIAQHSPPKLPVHGSVAGAAAAGAAARPAAATSAVPIAPSSCPPAVAVTRCMADPCTSKKCAAGQVCESNYCGGCNAVCKPKAVSTSSSSSSSSSACPPGKPQAMCLVDPCRTTNCAAGKICVSNYCGGCNAICKPRAALASSSSSSSSSTSGVPRGLATAGQLPPIKLVPVPLPPGVPLPAGKPLTSASSSSSSSSSSVCPPGKPQVNCFVDPCRSKKCGPGETCLSSYCGGCNAVCLPAVRAAGGPPSAAAAATPLPILPPTGAPNCPYSPCSAIRYAAAYRST
uniref:Uncharacterized protein n=1 Tax=Tetradesmus obliquus TaxID=3088 RepID=A0A383VST8_TETOB|eukprot:jgi/Sobl393_1/16412/SZX67794.1